MESIPHYYGDKVRRILLICGVLMLITLPFLKENITSSFFYSILAILALAFFAGMTNPRHKATILGDILVSVLAFAVFSYQTIGNFNGATNLYFITNLTLSILSLFAFYWSIKTIRWLKFIKKDPIDGTVQIDKNVEIKITDQNITDITPENIANHSTQKKSEPSEEDRRKKRFLNSE